MRILALILLLICGNAQAALVLSDLAPHRTSGVAPLHVSLKMDTTGGSTYTFHQEHYRCDSGDSTMGATTYGAQPGKSLRYQEGPVVGFVYETPGTYTLSCSVTDGTTTSTKTSTITVYDWTTAAPGPEYTAAQTACVNANSAVFTGCPSGATQINQGGTGNYATAAGYLTTGTSCGGVICKRVLLKGGDTFTLTASVTHNITGPAMIGSYGTGKAIISQTGGTTAYSAVFNFSGTASDLRFVDLTVDGNDNGYWQTVRAVGATMTNILFMGIDITDMSGMEMPIDEMAAVVDGFGLFGSSFSSMTSGNSNNHGFLIAGTNVSVIDNSWDGTAGSSMEHHNRFQFLNKARISHNTLLGSPNFNGAKEDMSIRAPCSASCAGGSGSYYPAKGLDGATAMTKFVVVSDNKLTTNHSGIQVTAVNPADSATFNDIIIERNWVKSNGGAPLIKVLGDYLSVRNNIVNMTSAGTNDRRAIMLDDTQTGVGAPDVVFVDNNSVYSNTSGDSWESIDLNSATNTTLRNNIGYYPASSSRTMIAGTPTSATGNTCNTANCTTGMTTDPGFVNGGGSMALLSDFYLAASASDFDQGVAAFPATYSDIYWCRDSNASRYRRGAIVPSSLATCSASASTTYLPIRLSWLLEAANDPLWRVAVNQ